MAFLNEYISADDVEKYDLDTLDKRYGGGKRSWVIDRDTDTWLISLGSGKENDGERWLFYWESNVYRVTTKSQDAKQDGINYNVRRKIISLYDAQLRPASGFDVTKFLSALKAAMEIRKAYGMANTELQNSMVYHIDLVLGA